MEPIQVILFDDLEGYQQKAILLDGTPVKLHIVRESDFMHGICPICKEGYTNPHQEWDDQCPHCKYQAKRSQNKQPEEMLAHASVWLYTQRGKR